MSIYDDEKYEPMTDFENWLACPVCGNEAVDINRWPNGENSIKCDACEAICSF